MAGDSTDPFRAPENPQGAQPLTPVPFEKHVELLRVFLARRDEIAGRIEGLLNAQRKPPRFLQDVPLLARHFEECFFTLPGITAGHRALQRQLDEAHWASGFKPRQSAEHYQDLIEPAEMMSRAFLMWQRTRWPGQHGRALYAHTLFSAYVLRRLMLLSMRLWDAGRPRERLAAIQALLDELGRTTPSEQPVFVRDARWLLPLAQSPTTDELHGYFEVAERIAATLSEEDRFEICSASVRMAGGHLRSQLRHVSTQKGVPIDERILVSSTRRSNALDLAMSIQSLVPLLAAYERAIGTGNDTARFALADAICQGISPDPELFLSRLDLLAPYSMIEHLFIAPDRAGNVGYTPMGQRHLRLLQEYAPLIGRLSKPLHDDCARFRPLEGTYSPYGVLYGFSSRLLEHMALKAAQSSAATRFTLEDVFAGGDAEKLAWVVGWRKLPHVPREVAKLFDYPQQFAEDVFERIERALRKRVDGAEARDGPPNGRLIVVPEGGDPTEPATPALPIELVISSDRGLVAANKASACGEAELLHSRAEGELIVSYRTSGGWVGITKDVLTEVVGSGRDAEVAGLPSEAAQVLRLMGPGFVVLAGGRAP